MTKCLVTGVAGFIGRHVAADCLAAGMEVVGVDDLSGGFVENVPEGVRFIQADVCDDRTMTELFETEGFDYVYHLAAYAAEGLSHFIRRFNYTNNLIGSVTLINAAVRTKVKCFVFTSSIAVYGANQLPMVESLTPMPEDPYGVSKYAVELDLEAAHRMFGLDYVIFRPHNVYGEFQNIADKYRNVIGIFMNQVMKGEAMTVYGDGTQTRAFSYVKDMTPIIARSPFVEAARNQVFNIGADKPYTVNELATRIAETFGVEPNIVHLPARNEVAHAYAAHDKVNAIFGQPETTGLTDGLARMAAWCREIGPRRPVEFGEIEVWDKLPGNWVPKG